MAAYATYLGVDICDVGTLLGVMTFVDRSIAVEVLSNNLSVRVESRDGMRRLDLSLDSHGTGLLLNLVDFAQGILIGSKG